jgi:hypothetical protein
MWSEQYSAISPYQASIKTDADAKAARDISAANLAKAGKDVVCWDTKEVDSFNTKEIVFRPVYHLHARDKKIFGVLKEPTLEPPKVPEERIYQKPKSNGTV